MNSLLELILGIVGDLAFDRIWRIVVGAVLGLGAAYLLVVVLGMDYHPAWPYVVASSSACSSASAGMPAVAGEVWTRLFDFCRDGRKAAPLSIPPQNRPISVQFRFTAAAPCRIGTIRKR